MSASSSSKGAARVKEVAKEEAITVKKLTVEAAKSGAYLYPIRGIYYFISHKTLWKPLWAKLLPSLTLGTAITVGMFMVAYVPQAAVMAFTQGPLAAVSAAILTLSESSTLFTILSKTLLLEDAMIDTFDATLVAKGQESLVAQGREVKAGSDAVGKLGKLIKRPFAKFAPAALIRYLLYLPLNFIPVVGTIMFIILQGRKAGPGLHDRYFQLKAYSSSQKEEHVEKYKGPYTSFGITATLLEMVPLASILFAFTNLTGAALWAADMEKGHIDGHGTSPNLREQAKKAE